MEETAAPTGETDALSAEKDEGLSAGGSWLELAVEADPEAVEAVSEILGRVAPGGVSVQAPFALVDEGLAAMPERAKPAVVRAYLPGLDASATRQAVRDVRIALGHLQAFELRPIGELRTRVVHESDWAAAWKRHFPVLRVGRRMVIRPTWRRHRPEPSDVVLALDPGMAFGTGLHPTTRLCLRLLEEWADQGLVEGSRVLDVGCGSGILAIAAARLGASVVLGIDTDPVAVEATTANARRNRVAGAVRACRGSLPADGSPYDLVLANLIASLLITLASELRAAVRPAQGGGRAGKLIASGIFTDREREVIEAFEQSGLRLVGRRQEGDWVALEAERVG